MDTQSTASPFSFSILFDPTTIYYSLTEKELSDLVDISKNNSRDLTIAFLCLFLPSAGNAIIEVCNAIQQKIDLLTATLFVNGLLTGITFVLTIVFACMWRRSYIRNLELVEKIKKKPKWQVNVNLGVGDSFIITKATSSTSS